MCLFQLLRLFDRRSNSDDNRRNINSQRKQTGFSLVFIMFFLKLFKSSWHFFIVVFKMVSIKMLCTLFSLVQLSERSGQDIPSHLHAHSTRCAEDSSQDHWHCRNTLHLQRALLQVSAFLSLSFFSTFCIRPDHCKQLVCTGCLMLVASVQNGRNGFIVLKASLLLSSVWRSATMTWC